MRRIGKALTFVATLSLLTVPLVVWWQAQAITDWWALKDYNPPAEIVSLADKTTMTDYGRKVFYVNHPLLIEKVETFREECPDSEQTIVLGCYHSGQRGIMIYDIADKRLNGIQEVTAAHELLHAGYERLAGEERDYVNRLLNDYYSKELDDKRVREAVDLYKKLESKDLINEMHSIFGTEIEELPASLEQYYKRYFTDRSVVVGYADQYEKEFESRTNTIKTYDKQLAALKAEIENLEISLKNQLSSIEAERSRLDSLRESGRVAEYNSRVNIYNSMVNRYNSGISLLKSKIQRYNEMVEERNAIARELRSLDSAIDTRLQPQQIE